MSKYSLLSNTDIGANKRYGTEQVNRVVGVWWDVVPMNTLHNVPVLNARNEERGRGERVHSSGFSVIN